MPGGAQKPKLIYAPTLDELFVKRLGPELTPRARERLRAVGLDVERPLEPAYTLAVLDAALEVVAEELLGDLPRPDAFRRLGELQVEAFASTLVGRAAFPILRMFSAEMYLRRLMQTWRGANNFVEPELKALGGRVFEVRINDVGRFPEVIQGVLAAGLVRSANPGRVELTEASQRPACTYRITLDR